MKTVHEMFIGTESSHARLKPSDIFLDPAKDILIGAAVLVGTVALVIFFRFLHRKWNSQRYNRTPSELAPSQKKGLTQYEKRMLAQKIRDTRNHNFKKSFAGEDNTNYMILATVGLIVITLLWLLYVISKELKQGW